MTTGDASRSVSQGTAVTLNVDVSRDIDWTSTVARVQVGTMLSWDFDQTNSTSREEAALQRFV